MSMEILLCPDSVSAPMFQKLFHTLQSCNLVHYTQVSIVWVFKHFEHSELRIKKCLNVEIHIRLFPMAYTDFRKSCITKF